jgi:hypothetical protein
MFCFSSLVAPVIGGMIHDAWGYNRCLDIMMIAEIVVFLIFIIFNCGFNVYSKYKKDLKIL